MSDDAPPVEPAKPGAADAAAARTLVARRALVPIAFEHLTVDALTTLPYAARGPTKVLVRRFFSADHWTAADAAALARAAGPGEGWWSRPLDDELSLEFGWRDGRFTVLASWSPGAPPASVEDPLPDAPYPSDAPDASADPVIPEATRDPQTVRFRTGPSADGDGAWYESATSAHAYWRAAGLFDRFPDVVDVRIGPDCVDVTLRSASAWGRLLDDVRAAVGSVFDGAGQVVGPRWLLEPGVPGDIRLTAASRRANRLAEVWAELGGLRPADDRDLKALITASYREDPVYRQVVASVLLEADPAVAAGHWERLLADPSASVRRAAADAIAIAGCELLRPLLERALGDDDGWVRQTAITGLVELGPDPSHDAIVALSRDPDFRVRLEVAHYLRLGEPPA